MGESNNHARNVELADLSAIMRIDSGRKVLARILRTAGLNTTTFVQDNPDETIRRSIRRDLGVWLAKEIKEAEPDLYYTLLKEIDNG